MAFSQHPYPAFGPRLRQARRANGMKQFALADLLGVDQATVSRWESGEQVPNASLQHAAFEIVRPAHRNDGALRRLIEQSKARVHLIDEASHICLAYSAARARDWRTSRTAMLGASLWPFATEDIRREEEALKDVGWWDQRVPLPRRFSSAPCDFEGLRVTGGEILWERLYLDDGTAVRLVSGSEH